MLYILYVLNFLKVKTKWDRKKIKIVFLKFDFVLNVILIIIVKRSLIFVTFFMSSITGQISIVLKKLCTIFCVHMYIV